SPMNPFQVGIAQKLSGLPLLSAAGFRLVFLALALGLWIAGTIRYARATRTAPLRQTNGEERPLDIRDGLVLITILITFGIFIVDLIRYGCDFDHVSALFFVMD